MDNGAKKTICIVDDGAKIREMFSLKLTAEGFDVMQADDGSTALPEALARKPDLLILDENMPRMTGFEMLKQVRAEGPWGQNVPAIFFTNVSPEGAKQFEGIVETTPAFYLVKSNTTPDELVAKVREVLG